LTIEDTVFHCDTRGMGDGLLKLLGKGAKNSTPMNSGDVAFWGIEPNRGNHIWIGIEHTTLRGLLGDIQTNRKLEQIRKMNRDYDRSWIMVETGIYKIIDGCFAWLNWGGSNGRGNGSGNGNKWQKSKFLFSAYENWITEIQEFGVRVKTVQDLEQSARSILAMYSWYQKSPEQHELPSAVYHPFVFENKASLPQMVAGLLDGVGIVKAREIGKVVDSVEDLLNMNEEELAKISWNGKKGRSMSLGKKTAGRIVKQRGWKSGG